MISIEKNLNFQSFYLAMSHIFNITDLLLNAHKV
jgi:hypothetical protein